MGGGGGLRRLVESRARLVIFVAALAARLLVWLYIPLDWNWDSYHHWQISYLSLSIGFGRGRLWGLNGCEYFWGMVPHLVQSALMWTLGTSSMLPYRVFNTVLGGLNSVLVYRIGERFYSRRTGLFSGLLFAVFPVAAVFDAVAMQDTLALSFLLASLSTISERPFLSGVALALAGHSRVELMAVGFIVLLGYCLRERLNTESLPYVLGWLMVMMVFGFHLYSQTGNPLYPLYISLYNVFGGWDPGNQGETFLGLMLGWVRWKLSVWPFKPTGLVILSLGATAAIMVPRMARRRWIRYQPQLYLLASAVVLTPIFITYLGADHESLLIMLRMVNPVTALGLPMAAHFSHTSLEKPLPELKVRPAHVVAAVFIVSYLWFLPVYGGFQAYTAEAFFSADVVQGLYDGGTIVCDYPTINYWLVHVWGVEPEALLGNHYSPHYYGIDDPLAYAEWLEDNDVTLWLKTDFRGEPILDAVQANYPDLFEQLYGESYTVVYKIDQNALESILVGGNS
jgi:hypothetical protein